MIPMTSRRTSNCIRAAAFAAVLGSSMPAFADIFWDGSGNGQANGWGTASFWSTTAAAATPDPANPPGAADIATFAITGTSTAQTVNLGGPQSALGIATANQTTTTTLLGGGTNQVLSLGTSGISHLAGALVIGSATAGQQVSISLQGAQSWTGSTTGTGAVGMILNTAVSIGAGGDQTLTLTGTNTGSTIAGAVTDGAGVLSLSKTSSGRWNLSGNSGYTGTTSVTGGTLNITNGNALGASSAGTTVTGTANNANLTLSGSITVPEPITIVGNGDTTGTTTTTNGVLRSVSGTNVWSGNVTINASATTRITVDAGLFTISGNVALSPTAGDQFVLQGAGNGAISGVISGVGSLTKGTNGTGTWTISGANTFTGKSTVTAGTLSVASINSVSGGSATSNLGAPTTVLLGTIDIGGSNTTGTLTYTGTGETTDRVLNLPGTSGGGGTVSQAGTGLLKFTSALAVGGSGTKTLTLRGATAGTGELAGSIVNGGGTVGVTKLDSGLWTLSAANTYNGPTTVSAGTLRITGSSTLGGAASTAVVTVADAGLLDLQTIALPDGSTMSVTSTDSTAEVSLGYSGSDTIGGLTLNGNVLPAGVYGSTASGAADNGNITGLGLNPNDFFSGVGTLNVVPEPASAGLLAIAAIGLLKNRRRRRA
jgi:autotransporter-associated beta strand protein